MNRKTLNVLCTLEPKLVALRQEIIGQGLELTDAFIDGVLQDAVKLTIKEAEANQLDVSVPPVLPQPPLCPVRQRPDVGDPPCWGERCQMWQGYQSGNGMEYDCGLKN